MRRGVRFAIDPVFSNRSKMVFRALKGILSRVSICFKKNTYMFSEKDVRVFREVCCGRYKVSLVRSVCHLNGCFVDFLLDICRIS